MKNKFAVRTIISNHCQDKGGGGWVGLSMWKTQELRTLWCFSAEETKDGACTSALGIWRHMEIQKVSAATEVIIFCSSIMHYIFQVPSGHPKYLHKELNNDNKKTPNRTLL